MSDRPRPVMVACPCCGGEGRVELTGTYRETLALLKRQRAEVNGAALARLAGCQETAMNNRLVRLERLGLAVGRRHGRERLWRARP
jgi:biotin operon repressor